MQRTVTNGRINSWFTHTGHMTQQNDKSCQYIQGLGQTLKLHKHQGHNKASKRENCHRKETEKEKKQKIKYKMADMRVSYQ